MSENQSQTSIRVVDVPRGQDLNSISLQEILLPLWDSGVVLVDGLDIDLRGFEGFTHRFCDRFHRSAARDELRQLDGDGYSVRTPEGNFTLFSHNEGSYRPFEPAHLAFFLCIEAPSHPGGETLLADGRAFYNELPANLSHTLNQEGIVYSARWDEERWQAELGVNSVGELEELAKLHDDFSFTFEHDEMLYRCRRRVIIEDLQGELVFANAMLAHLPSIPHPGYTRLNPYARESNQVLFGNGQVPDDRDIRGLIDIQDKVGYEHSPSKGDLLIIDNSRVMHGRRSTAGDCRRVLLTRFGYLKDQFLP